VSASLIETLAALQEIDRRTRDREREIAEIERQTAETAVTLEDKRRQVEATRSDSSQVISRRRDLETQLQDEEQKIKDRRMRLSRIRNDKELIAAQREIEVTKEANSRLEEELLTLFEQNEAVDGTLREAEEELRGLEELAQKQEATFTARARELRAEIDAEKSTRDQIASGLSVSIRKKYEQIFARRGGIAVVEVRHGNCKGCNMNVPPQLYIEIQKRRDVILCPNCHRILFWRPEVAQMEPDEEGAASLKRQRHV